MSAGDIAIQIDLGVERRRLRPTFTWPPHITRNQVTGPLEGLPGRIGAWQGRTLLGRSEVFVLVVFGRARPSDRQLARANAELRRVRFG